MILGYHANTDYAVVDPELIESLYRRHYHERVSGRERLRFLNVSRVADVVPTDDHVELAVESLLHGEREVLSADLVIYATGYRPSDPRDLVGGLAADRAGRRGAARHRPGLPGRHRSRPAGGHPPAGTDRAHARAVVDPAVQHRRAQRRDRPIDRGARGRPRLTRPEKGETRMSSNPWATSAAKGAVPEIVSNAGEISLEKVAALKPDLILALHEGR
ncbi:SidA/IucD/PvdA family monooxygenase [Pseudonocardia xishanensis]|uniref:L-lysine N6-monooxygenase MbtG n=1 Tax=Pseudonocardia xishanensis TaxID=630995 RepID=A0ABP8RUG8_9PSEU